MCNIILISGVQHTYSTFTYLLSDHHNNPVAICRFRNLLWLIDYNPCAVHYVPGDNTFVNHGYIAYKMTRATMMTFHRSSRPVLFW